MYENSKESNSENLLDFCISCHSSLLPPSSEPIYPSLSLSLSRTLAGKKEEATHPFRQKDISLLNSLSGVSFFSLRGFERRTKRRHLTDKRKNNTQKNHSPPPDEIKTIFLKFFL
jgi:hypothetical protein